MCGIAGIIGYFEADLEQKVRAMGDAMPHRGPDDHGYYLEADKGVGFAHRRLSILDVTRAGVQPMESRDGRQVICYNGEVYNFLEIRAELKNRGYAFNTGTDTEVILAAYQEWGQACLERFNGMWAFALYDRPRGEIFLARDRLGIKPLYYSQDSRGCLYFASEIKSILAAGDTSPELNLSRLGAYMGYGYVPGETSMFKGIHRLLPGHSMTLKVKKPEPRPRRYWDFEFDTSQDLGLDHYVEQGRDLLNSAIELRLRSDVPLGIFLSGGLDSSAVVGLLAPRVSKPLKTFSVAYDLGKGYDETPHARQVAEQFNTDHHEFFVSQQEFRDFIPGFVRYMDEPVTEAAAISLYYISKLAKDHVTVVLSGEGSDEIFGGYDFYRYMGMLDRYHGLLGASATTAIAKAAAGFLPDGNKLRKYLALGALPLAKRYKGISTYDSTLNRRLFKPGVRDAIVAGMDKKAREFEARLFQKTVGQDALNRMLYFDTRTWLVDDLLIKADRMSMAASLELRVPFLDYRMVEFAATVPVKYKIHNGSHKYLLKQMMDGILPDNIINRKKMGFPTPLKRMFQDQLADYSREVLTDSSAKVHRFFNPKAVEKLLDEHIGGDQDHHRVLWQLLVFEIWCRTWLKSR